MTIPNDFNGRLPLWVAASVRLRSKADPFLMIAVQELGYAERTLLPLEGRLLDAVLHQQRENEIGPDPYLISEAFALARLWFLGLYEALRTFREAIGKDSAEFAPLQQLFQKVEIARMPLAKHEPKGQKVHHYPQLIVRPGDGLLGWNAYDPKTGQMVQIFRRKIADAFLSASSAATAGPAMTAAASNCWA